MSSGPDDFNVVVGVVVDDSDLSKLPQVQQQVEQLTARIDAAFKKLGEGGLGALDSKQILTFVRDLQAAFNQLVEVQNQFRKLGGGELQFNFGENLAGGLDAVLAKSRELKSILAATPADGLSSQFERQQGQLDNLIARIEKARGAYTQLNEARAIAGGVSATQVPNTSVLFGNGADQEAEVQGLLENITQARDRLLQLREVMQQQPPRNGLAEQIQQVSTMIDNAEVKLSGLRSALAELGQTQKEFGGATFGLASQIDPELLALAVRAGLTTGTGGGRLFVQPGASGDVPALAPFEGEQFLGSTGIRVGEKLTGAANDVAAALGEQKLFAMQEAEAEKALQQATKELTAQRLLAGELTKVKGVSAFASPSGEFFGTNGLPLTDPVKLAQAQAAAAAGSGGGIGAFFTGVANGFGGRGFGGDGGFLSENFGAVNGMILRYTVLYRIFRSIEDSIKSSFDELINFEAAVTQLNFVLGTTRDNARAIADTLGDIASSGGLSPAEGVNLGAQTARAFQGQGSPQDLAQVGATVGTQLSVLGNLKPEETTKALTDAIAVTRSFNLTFNDTARVLDVATSAAQNFGFANANDVLPGLAQIADLAAESGFSLEQTANLIADIEAKTGETSAAAAGELRRFLGREGNAAFQKIFTEFGVDTTKSLEQEFAQFAPIFAKLSDTQRGAVIGEFGGGRAGAAVTAFLTDYNRILQESTKSENSAGLAAQQYNARLNDVSGLIRQVRGDLKNLFKDIGESGAFNLLGALLVTLNPVLKALDDIVRAFDDIERHIPFHNVAIAVLELVGALKLLSATSLGASIGGKLASTSVGAALGARLPTGVVAGSAAEMDVLAATAAGAGAGRLGSLGAALSGSSATLAANMGRFATSLGVAAVIFDVVAIGDYFDAQKKLTLAYQQQADAMDAAENASTAQQLHEAQQALIANAKDIQRGASSFGGQIGLGIGALHNLVEGRGLTDQRPINAVSQDLAEAQRLAVLQRQVEAQQSAEPSTVFGQGNSDIAGGLANLNAQGLSAKEQVDALNKSLGFLGDQAQATAQSLANTSAQLAVGSALQGRSGLGMILDQLGGSSQNIPVQGLAGTKPTSRSDAIDTLNKLLTLPSTSDTAAVIQKDLTSAGVGPGDMIDSKILEQIQRDIAAKVKVNDVLPLTADGRKKLQGAAVQAISKLLVQATGASLGQPMSAGEALAAFQAVLPTLQNVKPNPLLPNDISGIQSSITTLEGLRNQFTSQGAEVPSALTEALDNFYSQADQSLVKNAEAVVKAFQATHSDTAQTVAEAQAELNKLVPLLAQRGDVASLVQVLSEASAAEAAAIDQKFADALTAAQASFNAANNIIAHAQRGQLALEARTGNASPAAVSQAAGSLTTFRAAEAQATPSDTSLFTGLGGDAAKSAADAERARLLAEATSGDPVSEARAQLAAAQHDLAKAARGSADYWNAIKAVHDAQRQLSDAEATQAEAAAQADVYPGSQLSQAEASVRAAEIQLRESIRGTADYYNAIKSYRAAQLDLGKALLALANNEELLGGDLTNPVFTAQAAADKAFQQLYFDAAHGAPKDVVAADQVSAIQAQYSAQKAQFEQNLQLQQDQYDLHKESAGQFLTFLRNQESVLRAQIAGTRQGTQGYFQLNQELTEVEKTIQQVLNSADSQFNLGDITLPTPYEVRRSIQSQMAGLGVYGGTSVQTVTINISGGDLAQVRSALDTYLGPQATQRAGTIVRKV